MALEGDLSEFHLTDIIQLVDLSKKTGGVFVQGKRGSETLEGWLYFRDGKIVGARLGNLPPFEAALTFFTCSSGPFRFHDNVTFEGTAISTSNEMLIMQGIERQDEWEHVQAQLPPLSAVLRYVANPSSSGSEINIQADEWRVLTMVNGRNTVSQIVQRSGLGEQRTRQIVAQLLGNGLIEKRETNLVEALYPEMERIVTQALGPSARGLLEDAYMRVGIQNRAAATQEQVISAVEVFEASANRAFGPNRVRQPVNDVRNHVLEVFSAMA